MYLLSILLKVREIYIVLYRKSVRVLLIFNASARYMQPSSLISFRPKLLFRKEKIMLKQKVDEADILNLEEPEKTENEVYVLLYGYKQDFR